MKETPTLMCPNCGYLNIDFGLQYICTHCGFFGKKTEFTKHAHRPEFIQAPYKAVDRAPTLDQLDKGQDD